MLGRRRNDSSIRIIGSGDLVPPRRRSVGRRRVRPLLVTLLVVAVAVGAFVSGRTLWDRVGDDSDDVTATPTCTPAAPPMLPLLRPQQVVVRIYNATPRQGLGAQTAAALKARGFRVTAVDNTRPLPGFAQVRYAPGAERHARTLGEHVGRPAYAGDARIRGTVDLVLGPGFQRLRTPQEIAAARAVPAPSPSCR